MGLLMTLEYKLKPEWIELQNRTRALADLGVEKYGKISDSWINGYSKEYSILLASEGLIGMTWPLEFGGAGRPDIERVITADEFISAGAPIAASWIADRQMGPSIFKHGTADQRERFLPGILNGSDTWCIGMSEPNAGSDLAALQTSAVREGNFFRVNGQKIWTSLAAESDYCYLIVRTSNELSKHHGISELIVPMTLAGIEIRPIVDIIGNEHFCEIFFTDVLVPIENLVGIEGNSFRQTMSQLEHERGGIDRLVSNRPLYDLALTKCDRTNPTIRNRIATIETRYRLGRLMIYQAALGQSSSSMSSIIKCFCTEHEQDVADFCFHALGMTSLVEKSVSSAILYARAYTIQGGTSEIMRSIISERLLGLPK